jgi:methyltransferase
MIGAPQIFALIILAQRIVESACARANAKRLLSEGAIEHAVDFMPAVIVTHLAWIASIFLLIPADTEIVWGFVMAYAVLQPARYWTLFTLGRYWTLRMISLDTAPVVTTGPFRFFRHPNYVVIVLETMAVPLSFGQWRLCLIMTPIIASVLYYKMKVEDAALTERRQAAAVPR